MIRSKQIRSKGGQKSKSQTCHTHDFLGSKGLVTAPCLLSSGQLHATTVSALGGRSMVLTSPKHRGLCHQLYLHPQPLLGSLRDSSPATQRKPQLLPMTPSCLQNQNHLGGCLLHMIRFKQQHEMQPWPPLDHSFCVPTLRKRV